MQAPVLSGSNVKYFHQNVIFWRIQSKKLKNKLEHFPLECLCFQIVFFSEIFTLYTLQCEITRYNEVHGTGKMCVSFNDVFICRGFVSIHLTGIKYRELSWGYAVLDRIWLEKWKRGIGHGKAKCVCCFSVPCHDGGQAATTQHPRKAADDFWSTGRVWR